MRFDYKSEIGKYLYTWSNIRKHDLPKEVSDEIVDAIVIREKVLMVECYYDEELLVYELKTMEDDSFSFYSRWRTSFYDHGYDPPILILD